MHGLKGGGWKRKRPGHGHHRWDDLAGNRRNADPGTYHRLAPPRLPPTLLRHGVSKAVFSAIDSLAWGRIMRWLRRKYKRGRNRTGMTELRRRFCDKRWQFAWNGVAYTGASSVTVKRYRYRGNLIPTPWTPEPAATSSGG